ncbi:hypothetical protein ACWIGI_41370 [Nocardia sp. NPDC055321]
MSDETDFGVEVYTVTGESVRSVLDSRDEFDGFTFAEDDTGVTVLHGYGGLWSLNLFLLALAKGLGPTVRPDHEGFEQIYQTLFAVTMCMSFPVLLAKDEQYWCTMPNLRIIGDPTTAPSLNQ